MPLKNRIVFAKPLKLAVLGLALGAVSMPATSLAEMRQLSAHEHGVSTLKIAQEGDQLLFVLEAPGADIVGFEHAAENKAQKKAVQAALVQLKAPAGLFPMPEAAGCSVTASNASFVIEAEDDHDHDHSNEAKKADDHDHDHDHDNEAKNADAHDHDHDHSKEAKKADAHDHGHDDNASEAKAGGHAEFQASWTMTCKEPKLAVTSQTTYFEAFEGAKEIKVEAIGASGQQVLTLTRSAPLLDLSGVSG
ncbi:MAG: DUF2796 domain-containing protein [Pseudomonadota bacterium]